MRLPANQENELGRVRELRKVATDLRSRVSQGSYDSNDLVDFWQLTSSAGVILRASNPQLAAHAGLGEHFFSTVARDRRRPKLQNFLRALTAIIELANERLFDVEKASSVGALSNGAAGDLRIVRDRDEFLVLATSLARIARTEIEKLESQRPNDPERIAKNEKQLQLLSIFASGFERIAIALDAVTATPAEALSVSQAGSVVRNVGRQLDAWWKENGPEAVDWGMRIPVFTAGVAMLNLAGANMTIATSAIAALVGGAKVVSAIRRRKGSR